eukprot:Sspe_Gene.45092::Locus_22236_Transcript_1_2_Confidence_0.800_Length_385::g.45092::m.45092
MNSPPPERSPLVVYRREGEPVTPRRPRAKRGKRVGHEEAAKIMLQCGLCNRYMLSMAKVWDNCPAVHNGAGGWTCDCCLHRPRGGGLPLDVPGMPVHCKRAPDTHCRTTHIQWSPH